MPAANPELANTVCAVRNRSLATTPRKGGVWRAEIIKQDRLQYEGRPLTSSRCLMRRAEELARSMRRIAGRVNEKFNKPRSETCGWPITMRTYMWGGIGRRVTSDLLTCRSLAMIYTKIRA